MAKDRRKYPVVKVNRLCCFLVSMIVAVNAELASLQAALRKKYNW
jgi:hypothetical protein